MSTRPANATWRFSLRLKRSFGTAVKLWSTKAWANVSTYGKLGLLLVLAIGDPLLTGQFGFHQNEIHHAARDMLDKLLR